MSFEEWENKNNTALRRENTCDNKPEKYDIVWVK